MESLQEQLNRTLAQIEREGEAEARAQRARDARLEPVRAASPRVVYRDPGLTSMGDRATYQMLRLVDVRWQRAHTEEYFTLGSHAKHTRRRSDEVRVLHGSSSRGISPEHLNDYVRRPTARALARLEAAEEALRQARLEVKAATRAAFTYGRPVPLSAVKAATREYHRAWEGE